MTIFSGFYKKTRQQRIEILQTLGLLSPFDISVLNTDENLTENIAGQTTENHLGTFSLPFAVSPQALIDDKYYQIPLVTEEPSVVAALSLANKTIAQSGGFTTHIHNRLMIGEVVLYQIPDKIQAENLILKHQQSLLELANQAHISIVKRGGGARKIWIENKDEFFIVYLSVDVQEAMGANIINTMLEALKTPLTELTGGQCLMAILSNYATESLVTAQCHINISTLALSNYEARQIAEKIALASQLAQIDPYRAATHNKGIFNGIDAIVLATGNDWRAIEAACHTFASRDGQYRGLSTWSVDNDVLIGQLTLPLPLATVGGSIGLNPEVRVAFDLLQNPDAKTLSAIVASMGLSQNFAALRALVTKGIQAGHMTLQAKSLALLAGAHENEIKPVLDYLKTEKTELNLSTIQSILQKLRN